MSKQKKAPAAELKAVLAPIADALASVGSAKALAAKHDGSAAEGTQTIVKALFEQFGAFDPEVLFGSPKGDKAISHKLVSGSTVNAVEFFEGLKSCFAAGFSKPDMKLYLITDKKAATAAKLSPEQMTRWKTIRRMPNAYVGGNLKRDFGKYVEKQTIVALKAKADDGDMSAQAELDAALAGATLWDKVRKNLTADIKRLRDSEDSGCDHVTHAIKYMEAALTGDKPESL